MKTETAEFWVSAEWDDEHDVYFSKTNIPGLHIEAETLGLFEQAMFDLAPELIFENVIKPALDAQDVGAGKSGAQNGNGVPSKSAKVSARKIPEHVPFVWKGAAPRKINLAMA